jgi:hypothetical protein
MSDAAMPVVVVDRDVNAEERRGSPEMSEERKQILEMLAEGKINVDEAERLISALGEDAVRAEEQGGAEEGRRKVVRKKRYMRVLVNDGDENVNIRVPLKLIGAGMKLKALLPQKAQEKINAKLSEKGIDLGKLKGEDAEELLESLEELDIKVNGGDGENVKIFCE